MVDEPSSNGGYDGAPVENSIPTPVDNSMPMTHDHIQRPSLVYKTPSYLRDYHYNNVAHNQKVCYPLQNYLG